MSDIAADGEYGEPDDENPEWSEEDFRWAVRAQDFPDHAASVAFLIQRTEFLRAASNAGLSREAFWPFEPTKPGFFERVTAAMEAVLNATKHVTETKHAAE